MASGTQRFGQSLRGLSERSGEEPKIVFRRSFTAVEDARRSPAQVPSIPIVSSANPPCAENVPVTGNVGPVRVGWTGISS